MIDRRYIDNALNYINSIKGELETGLECGHVSTAYLEEKMRSLRFELDRVYAAGPAVKPPPKMVCNECGYEATDAELRMACAWGSTDNLNHTECSREARFVPKEA